METESKIEVPRYGGKGNEELVFHRDNEEVLKMDGGDSCTML